jgi:predicted RNA-binding Zn-ribbon protein involved in translation (DUF1610 family)/tRNA G10  N-methylase Trm11
MKNTKDNPIIINEVSELDLLKGEKYIKFKCINCNNTVIVQFRSSRRKMFSKLLCKDCKTKDTCLTKYGVEYAHQNPEFVEKMKETNLKKYGCESVFQNEKVKQKIKNTLKEKYGVESYTQTKEYLDKSKETCIKKYGVPFYTQTEEYKSKERETNLKKYGVEWASATPEIQDKVRSTFISKYGSANYCHNSYYLYDNIRFDSSWELYFYIYHSDLGHNVTKEPLELFYTYENKKHSYYPDFKVDGQLYEIKGDMFFKDGQMINPFDKSQNGLFNAKYQCGIKNNVIFIKESDMDPIIEYVNNKYTKNFVPLFKINLSFPYINSDLTDISDMGLIHHFHKSIYMATRKNKLSPLDAWTHKDLIKKVALNRLKYVGSCKPADILQGFNVTKIAPKISVFKPKLAETLIKKYIPNADIIIDPFSGFSGRMLGSYNCGIHYIGWDINEDHVRESNEIADYKLIGDMCDVKVQDLITFEGKDWSVLKDVCLFTCPPYGGKEHWNKNTDEIEKSCDEWIDLCLEKHKGCIKYLFVVDKTEKYKNYIVETLENKSHFGKNYEYVILI